ncbi:hypothetical protein E4U41_004286 [Claviceps citrina]|nr:hypothetical protein E4U41_004286 [Claviceps citrina]
MRFINMLAFACGAVALATGPVSPAADRSAPEASLFELEHAALQAEGIGGRDTQAISSDVEKRGIGLKVDNILFAIGERDRQIKLMGVTVLFVSTYRWVKQGTRNVYQRTKKMQFINETGKPAIIKAIANGVEFFSQRMGVSALRTEDQPLNADTFTLVVTSIDDEL